MHSREKPVKRCSKCDQEKELTSFGRDSSQTDGRSLFCKLCRRQPQSAEAIEADRLASKRMKKCSVCKVVKPFSAFNVDKTKRFDLSSGCKRCHKEKREQKHAEWRPRKEELQRLYLEDKSRCVKCGSVKRLKEFADRKDSKATTYRVCKPCSRRRPTRRTGANPDYENWEVFEGDNFVCYLCEDILDPELRNPHPKSLSIDHVIPISLGGPDVRSNVRTACLSCNLDKSNIPLEAYLAAKV